MQLMNYSINHGKKLLLLLFPEIFINPRKIRFYQEQKVLVNIKIFDPQIFSSKNELTYNHNHLNMGLHLLKD